MSDELGQFTFMVPPTGIATGGIPWQQVLKAITSDEALKALVAQEALDRIDFLATEEQGRIEPLRLRGDAHSGLEVYSLTMREAVERDAIDAKRLHKGDDDLAQLEAVQKTIVCWNRNPYAAGTEAHAAWKHAEVPCDRARFRLLDQRPRTGSYVVAAYGSINGVTEAELAVFRRASSARA